MPLRAGSPTYSRACVIYHNGFVVEFEPRSRHDGFPPEELVKLNAFAKQRAGVLFVQVTNSPPPSRPGSS